MQYVIDRLKEASTWRGIVAFATALGVGLTPEQSNAIIAVGLGIIGVIGAFFPDIGKDE